MAAPVSDERVAEILEQAREKMNQGGKHWIKFTLRRNNEAGEMCYCSLGGIYAVTSNKKEQNAAVKALSEAIVGVKVPYYSQAHRSVYDWNDSSTTKWADVARMFRKAAKIARKRAAA